jgi:hypothetical protein
VKTRALTRVAILIGLAAAAAALSLPTAAAGAWDAARVEGRVATAYADLTLALAADGTGLLGYTGEEPGNGGGKDVPILASPITAAGPGPAKAVAKISTGDTGSALGWLLPAGPGQMALVARSGVSTEPIRLATGAAGGALGTGISGANDNPTAVATSPRGDLAVAMTVRQPPKDNASQDSLAVVIRRPTGELKRVDLAGSAGTFAPVAIAFNDRGDLLIAYDDPTSTGAQDTRHRYRAQLVTAAGAVGKANLVAAVRSEADSFGASTLVASLGNDRRALVAWSIVPCRELHCGRTTIGVAAARKGLRFGRARVLARTGTTADRPLPLRVLVATAADDRGTIAWTAKSGDHLAVRSAQVTGGRVGRSKQVSAAGMDAAPAALTTGAGGATALLWTEAAAGVRADLAPTRLRSLTRAPRRAFGAAELVSDQIAPMPEHSENAIGSRVPVAAAIDPAGGRPAAVWQDAKGLLFARR